MPPRMTVGRTGRGGGTPQAPGRSRANANVPVPLPQSPPRFRRGMPVPPPKLSPVAMPRTAFGQSGAGPWRGGDNTFDGVIHRDRAGHFDVGYEIAGRVSSMPDPPSDGPIRPSLRLVNRTWNWQVGTGQHYTDDLTRPYTHLGEQGSGWTSVYGGAPGFYRMGPGGMPVGDPATGPGRVWAGPPHGLHTMYPPDGAQTQARYRARPQMVAPRVDRLSNARAAGQTYSQWTVHQGQSR
jgi:hypothetical protein